MTRRRRRRRCRRIGMFARIKMRARFQLRFSNSSQQLVCFYNRQKSMRKEYSGNAGFPICTRLFDDRKARVLIPAPGRPLIYHPSNTRARARVRACFYYRMFGKSWITFSSSFCFFSVPRSAWIPSEFHARELFLSPGALSRRADN